MSSQRISDSLRQNDLLTILGISAKGRATIECLQLNRPRVINVRRMLLALGMHVVSENA